MNTPVPTLPAAAWRDAQAAFLFAHDLFRAPLADQHAWLRSHSTQYMWTTLCRLLASTREDSTLPDRLDIPGSLEEYEQQFLAAFEVGLPHPPIPLVESHYRAAEPVSRVLHENILFHRAFGLELKEEARETADHLRHQLELVARLLDLGARAAEESDGEQCEQVELALEEFTARHLRTWLESALEKARKYDVEWVEAFLGLACALSDSATVVTSSAQKSQS